MAEGAAENHALVPARRARPVSPHLSIYKPQITSFTSIAHRLSGVLLLLGMVVFVGLLYEIAFLPDKPACIGIFLKTFAGKIALGGWSLALFYHLFNGIRHLFWDAGMGFELKVAETTGWLVIIASAAATAVAWMVAIS